MMAGTEAMDAMANADAALVVCRVGRTSRDDAERVQELLARLRVPAYGVVLLGSRDGGTSSGSRRRARSPQAVSGPAPSAPEDERPRADEPAAALTAVAPNGRVTGTATRESEQADDPPRPTTSGPPVKGTPRPRPPATGRKGTSRKGSGR
jgi:hypothetical protein